MTISTDECHFAAFFLFRCRAHLTDRGKYGIIYVYETEREEKVVKPMAAFTQKEFDTMISELFEYEEISFDTLCKIAHDSLENSVRRWCEADLALRGKGYEDDIMQDVYIRMMKTSITHFFKRPSTEGINRDVQGFSSWMFKIALNIKRDYSNRVRKANFNVGSIEDADTSDGALVSDICSQALEGENGRLSEVFSLVMDSDSQTYKILTWLAVSAYMIDLDVSRIRSTELVVESYADRTLYDMERGVLGTIQRQKWINISEAQKNKLHTSLALTDSDGREMGEKLYGDFFMKKGGKATVSDWVNRMNSMVRREISNEAFNG